MTSIEIVYLSIATSLALVVGIAQAPTLRDRIRRWYQILWLSPRTGELGILIEPPFEDIEALVFRTSRVMFPEARVPYDAVVLVIDVDGSSARVLWDDKVAVLPRRWLRRLKI
jgi:hypothetical protein